MRMGHPTIVPENYDPKAGERTDLDDSTVRVGADLDEGDYLGHGPGTWTELNSDADELFP